MYECMYVFSLKSSFSDINECAVENGGCSEVCNNTLGSYACACRAGFLLQPDGRTCEGKYCLFQRL